MCSATLPQAVSLDDHVDLRWTITPGGGVTPIVTSAMPVGPLRPECYASPVEGALLCGSLTAGTYAVDRTRDGSTTTTPPTASAGGASQTFSVGGLARPDGGVHAGDLFALKTAVGTVIATVRVGAAARLGVQGLRRHPARGPAADLDVRPGECSAPICRVSL